MACDPKRPHGAELCTTSRSTWGHIPYCSMRLRDELAQEDHSRSPPSGSGHVITTRAGCIPLGSKCCSCFATTSRPGLQQAVLRLWCKGCRQWYGKEMLVMRISSPTGGTLWCRLVEAFHTPGHWAYSDAPQENGGVTLRYPRGRSYLSGRKSG